MNGPSDPDEFDRLRAEARARLEAIKAAQLEAVHREIAESDGRAQRTTPKHATNHE